MARLFIDGFESGSLDLYEGSLIVSGYPQISTTQKETGAYSAAFGVFASHYLRKNITGISTLYFKFHYWQPATPANIELNSFWNDVGVQITLRINSSNLIEVRRGSVSGTIVGTGTHSLNASDWNLIEGKLIIADSGGVAQIKVNGILDVDFTGDTRNQASDALITNIRFGNASGSGSNAGFYIDNFVLDDAAWIGDTKIQAISPSGAGNSSQWTPSAGNNWDCVEEVPASDPDFVSINAVDQVDLYGAGDLAGSIYAVKCVQAQARCLKEGAPTPQNLQLACRTGSTNYFGANNAVPTAAASVFKIWETNPNTAAAWTPQDVNGLEIGIKSAA